MINIFLTAIALVFVIEGILPFACPNCWRNTIRRIADQTNKNIRILGLLSMIVGVVLLFLIHHRFI